MAGRIKDEDVALVRERSPVAEVIGEYLQLRNAGGGSLKGLCPFHDEKSPSFNVTPSRGLFYCFGCAEGGDVIAFIQKIDHLSFVEAVESLAQSAGVQLRYEQGGYVPRNEHGQRQRLLEAHRAAAEFYAEQLLSPRAQAGRQFLAERGFNRADAERFGVGFAPPGWGSLTTHLRHKGFTDAEIVLGGLAAQGQRGPYDKFRNRLLWPVRDVTGDVVGFGARKLDPDDDGPKYLNTQETPIFKKSALLYGLDLAKREIAKQRQAVVVEGYTDVMACHLAGIPTAVATCGTSFGEEHFKLLRRILLDRNDFQVELIFTFDGDAAGQKAALRAFAEEQRFVTQTFVAVQRDGTDPCDLRVSKGDAAVRGLVNGRVPLYELAIRSAIEGRNVDTPEGRLAALDAAAPVVAGIRDRSLRHLYARNLDRWLGIMDEEFVVRRVAQNANAPDAGSRRPAAGSRRNTAQNATDIPYDLRNPVLQRERQALKLAVQYPALVPGFDEVGAEAFTVPQHQHVLGLITAQGGVAASDPGVAAWAARLREAAEDEQLRDMVTQLAVEPLEIQGEPDDRYAAEILGTIRMHSINRTATNLKARLQRLDPVAEATEYQGVFAELLALEQQRRMMQDRSTGTP